jgi:hypothetical protein
VRMVDNDRPAIENETAVDPVEAVVDRVAAA